MLFTRSIYAILSFCLMVIFSLSCRKETLPFGKTKISGRLVHFITKQPMANTRIYLNHILKYQETKYDDANLASIDTDDNGNFTFETKVAKSNKYRLLIPSSIQYRNLFDTSFALPKSQELQLGDLNCGNHTFTAKVHLIPTSGNCIFIGEPVAPTAPVSYVTHKINSGIDTTLTFKRTLTYKEYKNNYYFQLRYIVTTCSTPPTSELPVNGSYLYNTNGSSILINLNY